MKWFISIVALYGALATALPSNINAHNLPDIQNVAGVGLAEAHKEGGDMPKRGICTDDDLDCCCQCAGSKAFPCIGCFGLKNCPHEKVRFVNKEKYYNYYTHNPHESRGDDVRDETAIPSNTKAINFLEVQDAVENDLADIHKERSDNAKRGICTDNDPDCCCQCAESQAFPCIGCKGEKQCINLGRVSFDVKPSIKIVGYN
ncbi:uncharacterized protein Triagg1_1299 [Trichoderma aggressivum f. europaeum]|uniref:Uncharacterized protein n=1 Tax=Trichoderma aggressivum f. europaeum TaxID=173218 RepID=A0AAE1IM41_9HYPO|nr:hypothetical protein Triagg1_1299 [Trichoderma aggressivum f. europaeum]